MLDHVSLRVADYERSKKFYVAALGPLGFTLCHGIRVLRRRLPPQWHSGVLDQAGRAARLG